MENLNEDASGLNTNLNDFANAIRVATSRKEVAELYNQSHHLTLKLISDFGWSSLSAIMAKISHGFSFKEATKTVIGLGIEDILPGKMSN